MREADKGDTSAERILELHSSPPQLTPKRKAAVSYEGMQGPAASMKRTRARPGHGGVTKHERSLSDLSDVLQGLAVVAEEKQAKRVSSASQNEAPTRIQKPHSEPKCNGTRLMGTHAG
jgi:hypothetical protein